MFKLTSFLIDDLHYWSYYVNRLEERYFLFDFEQFLFFLPGQHDFERRERLASVRTPERRLRRQAGGHEVHSGLLADAALHVAEQLRLPTSGRTSHDDDLDRFADEHRRHGVAAGERPSQRRYCRRVQRTNTTRRSRGDVDTIIDAHVALERCDDLFAADPIGCNMVAASLRSDVPTRLLRAHNGETTLGAALWWGTGWTLTRLGTGAAVLLADAVSTMHGEADRFSVMGEVGDVIELAGRWSELTGGAFETDEVLRVYSLAELRPPDVAGQVTAATLEDAALLVRWSVDFGADIGHPRVDDPTSQVTKAIEQGRIWMWSIDGQPVAQLWTTSARFGAVRIGGVYTPPHFRGNGYASALTAAVSADQRSRSSVDVIMLNTQASNAMTNRLYRRLGFLSMFDSMTGWLCSPHRQ